MKGEQKLISVIVTAYNRKQYLPYALRSLEAQTLPRDRFEVIVVKNFEDPASDEIIRRNGWKFVYSDESHQSRFLLAGLEEARGDVVTFLDDDDMYCRERLEEIYKAFTKYSNIVYFHNNFWIVDQNDNKIRPDSPLRNSQETDLIISTSKLRQPVANVGLCRWEYLALLRQDVWGNVAKNSSSIAVSRLVIDSFKPQIGPVNLGIDDAFFVYSLLTDGYLYITLRPLTHYRVHWESFDYRISSQRSKAFNPSALLQEARETLRLASTYNKLAKILPTECECNTYKVGSTGELLHLYIMPLTEVNRLEPMISLSEMISFMKCSSLRSHIQGKGFRYYAYAMLRLALPVLLHAMGSAHLKRLAYITASSLNVSG
ncbi:glycosyltransferase family A protein [Acidilobus sp.]|uniref:glycosyltransferase family A protein n=1 Tax=Acidilobus sp. TaxID=1872109 RepID=UPI003D08BE5C